MKIIDVHAHIYPEKIALKAVESISAFYGVPVCNDGTEQTLKRIADETEGLKFGEDGDWSVKKIVISSVATSAHQVKSINDFMASKLTDDRFLPLGTMHPDMSREEIRDETARVKELGLHGLKIHPDCQRFRLNGAKGAELFDALGDFKLPILVHTGDKRQNFSHPEYMVETARDYPHLTFIAAHFGGWSEWEQAMRYKGLKNVMFDTSSSLAFLDKYLAKVVILGLGAEKFMVGTDYPMWNYNEEIERLLSLDLGKENNEMIFHKNAERLFSV